MKFRYARHTNNLGTLIDFYQNIVGLEKLGGFKDHNSYDGVFFRISQSKLAYGVHLFR
ncbi:hypothetical protein [Psychrobacter piscatorii]|uniref:hypothetical protein n=1 Tax=Psychrobacter piscatorii TaxID=554343 RepID=UPI000A73848A